MENTTEITTEEYQKLLNNHDWQYCYSDDHGVYMNGAAESKLLHDLKKGRPELETLFNIVYGYNNKQPV